MKFRPKSGSKIFSKKKLFFLAMFKNEITTFKKNFFLKNPDFFGNFFQKFRYKIRLGPTFFMNFFLNRPVFCDRYRGYVKKIEIWLITVEKYYSKSTIWALQPSNPEFWRWHRVISKKILFFNFFLAIYTPKNGFRP